MPAGEVAELRRRPPTVAVDWARDRGFDLDLDLAEGDIPSTRAGEFTWSLTRDWTDAQLEAALAECWDDQPAVDAIAQLLDARDATDELVAAAGAVVDQHWGDVGRDAWAERPAWAEPDPVTDPGRRPASRLTVDQQVRADYEVYVDTQWLQAEADCNGQLLNAEARSAGVDSRSLFFGPPARALRWASEELQSWWSRHGRLTLAAFRHQALGRDSDRAAAERSKLGTFDNALTW